MRTIPGTCNQGNEFRIHPMKPRHSDMATQKHA